MGVDYKDERILVGDNIGGMKEFSKWVAIKQVKATWNIGGYDKAMKLIESFNGAMLSR